MKKVLFAFASLVILAGVLFGLNYTPSIGPEPTPCPPACGGGGGW